MALFLIYCNVHGVCWGVQARARGKLVPYTPLVNVCPRPGPPARRSLSPTLVYQRAQRHQQLKVTGTGQRSAAQPWSLLVVTAQPWSDHGLLIRFRFR